MAAPGLVQYNLIYFSLVPDLDTSALAGTQCGRAAVSGSCLKHEVELSIFTSHSNEVIPFLNTITWTFDK